MQVKGVELDPLVGLDDARKPLRSKVLSVPTLQARYLQYVRVIADHLDWSRIGPVVARYRTMIDNEVKIDTRKLETHEAFLKATADTAESNSAAPEQGWRAAPVPSGRLPITVEVTCSTTRQRRRQRTPQGRVLRLRSLGRQG
jgi:hypothetical protein